MSRVCQRCHRPNTEEAKFCFHCGAMLEAEEADAGDPLVGKILLGRYRVLKVLGEGGMGKVYLAEQKMGTATRKVAIKTLHPELGNDPQLVARFHRECETVIELSHPNTVQFYDFGELEGSLFIVMEYIEGESLAHVLERGPLEPTRVDKILIQICGSLHEAHQRGIVHRDLKPENILLTERGGQTDFVKVLDFGIAKRSEAEDKSRAKLTMQGMVLGTPPYMSPEQFSGQALDARSDIYSLAVMTYEMLAGTLPFTAATPWEWATKHLTTAPTPLESHPSSAALDSRKKTAIYRGLAKHRDDRHATILEYLNDFTGLHDPQAAWTMATAPQAAVVASPIAAPTTGARALPHAPTEMGPASTNMPAARAPAPPSGHLPARGWETGADAVAKPSGSGRWVVAAIVFLFGLGAAAAGGIYFWTQRGPSGPVAAAAPKDSPSVDAPRPNDPAKTSDAATAPDEPRPDVLPGMPRGADTPSEAGTNEPPTPPTEKPDVDPTPSPPPRPPPTKATSPRTPTKAPPTPTTPLDPARATTVVAGGTAALQRNDLPTAMAALKEAERLGGKTHSGVQSLRAALARRASNQIGIFVQQGRCADAQALYRSLRAVDAEGPSRDQFSDEWCRRP